MSDFDQVCLYGLRVVTVSWSLVGKPLGLQVKDICNGHTPFQMSYLKWAESQEHLSAYLNFGRAYLSLA